MHTKQNHVSHLLLDNVRKGRDQSPPIPQYTPNLPNLSSHHHPIVFKQMYYSPSLWTKSHRIVPHKAQSRLFAHIGKVQYADLTTYLSKRCDLYNHHNHNNDKWNTYRKQTKAKPKHNQNKHKPMHKPDWKWFLPYQMKKGVGPNSPSQ